MNKYTYLALGIIFVVNAIVGIIMEPSVLNIFTWFNVMNIISWPIIVASKFKI
jgi:hypothetical protein